MAESYFSRTTYPSSQTVAGDDTFPFDFTYIASSDVKVALDGVDTLAFTLVDASTVRLDTPLAEPSTVTVYRSTKLDARSVDFQNAAELTEADLDNSAQQVFLAMQEAYDLARDSVRPLPDGSVTLSERRLQGVATPMVDTDAATMGWVKYQYTSGRNAYDEYLKAVTAREGAESAQVAAKGSADKALASEGYALEYKNAADVSRDSAKADADSAALSETAAQTSATEAKTSATSSGDAKVAAQGYATDAAAGAAKAEDLAVTYAGSTVGFNAAAYDFGFVSTANTYFNRDFGSLV